MRCYQDEPDARPGAERTCTTSTRRVRGQGAGWHEVHRLVERRRMPRGRRLHPARAHHGGGHRQHPGRDRPAAVQGRHHPGQGGHPAARTSSASGTSSTSTRPTRASTRPPWRRWCRRATCGRSPRTPFTRAARLGSRSSRRPNPDQPGEQPGRLRRQEQLRRGVAERHALQRMVRRHARLVSAASRSSPPRPPGRGLRGPQGLPPGHEGGGAGQLGRWRWPGSRRRCRTTPTTSATRSPSRTPGCRPAASTTPRPRSTWRPTTSTRRPTRWTSRCKYDPANNSAADDLQIVRDKIREARRGAAAQRADFERHEEPRARPQRLPLPVLSPRSPVPITSSSPRPRCRRSSRPWASSRA